MQDAAEWGAITRVRPIVMTAMVASFGFLPLALSHGAGAEVQRAVGGLVTSALPALLFRRVLCLWLEQRQRESPSPFAG